MAKNQNEINSLIRKKPNVLSWRDDLTKITDGKDTGKPCITVFVPLKMKIGQKKGLLSKKDAIPKEIDGVPTDVVELNPNSDFELGETPIALKTPEEQKRMLGLLK